MAVRIGSLEKAIKSPVESLDGIWKFTREANRRSRCISLPGHLLHFIESGSYCLKTNGREYNISPGDLIYYHGSEQVEWIGGNSEVIFYSIGFSASGLKPLPLERRVFQSAEELKKRFKNLYEVSLQPNSSEKAFYLFSQLMKLLYEIEKLRVQFEYVADSDNIWSNIEKFFYAQRNFRPAIDELCEKAKCSRSTILRICKKITGKSPLARMQELRMAEAKALLKNSTLNVTQVAEYLGYSRIHEFSREFSHYFGHPPTSFCKMAPASQTQFG